MECFDASAHVYYPHHAEFVEPTSGGGTRALGVCARCYEILDLATVKRLAAQGHPRCQSVLRGAGLGYLADAEKAAEAALARLTPDQRAALLARHARTAGMSDRDWCLRRLSVADFAAEDDETAAFWLDEVRHAARNGSRPADLASIRRTVESGQKVTLYQRA